MIVILREKSKISFIDIICSYEFKIEIIKCEIKNRRKEFIFSVKLKTKVAFV